MKRVSAIFLEPRPWNVMAVILYALATYSVTGCEHRPAKRPAKSDGTGPRLVLLYATCTVNRNYLSPYDPRIPFTPRLEAFASGARVFTAHRTEAGLSGVAFASMFSGRQASGHGIFTHPTKLDESIYLIGEAFSTNGYDVFFWNDQVMASADLNYGQGIPENMSINMPWLLGTRSFGRS